MILQFESSNCTVAAWRDSKNQKMDRSRLMATPGRHTRSCECRVRARRCQPSEQRPGEIAHANSKTHGPLENPSPLQARVVFSCRVQSSRNNGPLACPSTLDPVYCSLSGLIAHANSNAIENLLLPLRREFRFPTCHDDAPVNLSFSKRTHAFACFRSLTQFTVAPLRTPHQ